MNWYRLIPVFSPVFLLKVGALYSQQLILDFYQKAGVPIGFRYLAVEYFFTLLSMNSKNLGELDLSMNNKNNNPHLDLGGCLLDAIVS